MRKRSPPKYAKNPPTLDPEHDCTKLAVLVEKLKSKDGKKYAVYQCQECAEIWEEEL